MIADNARSLAALKAIQERHPELCLDAKIAALEEVCGWYDRPENFTATGRIFDKGARSLTLRELALPITEIYSRRIDATVDRAFRGA